MVLRPSLLLAACQPGGPSAAPSSNQGANGAQGLTAALDALAAQPDAQRLADARRAWRQVQGTWETKESWAFGPADIAGFAGHLDDWPVNEKDLRTTLAAGSLTPELFAKLTTTARGFHGIEAVLFGASGERPQTNADLDVNAQGLLAAWRASNP